MVKAGALIFYIIGYIMSRNYSDMYHDIEQKNERAKEGSQDNEFNEKKEELLKQEDPKV